MSDVHESAARSRAIRGRLTQAVAGSGAGTIYRLAISSTRWSAAIFAAPENHPRYKRWAAAFVTLRSRIGGGGLTPPCESSAISTSPRPTTAASLSLTFDLEPYQDRDAEQPVERVLPLGYEARPHSQQTAGARVENTELVAALSRERCRQRLRCSGSMDVNFRTRRKLRDHNTIKRDAHYR